MTEIGSREFKGFYVILFRFLAVVFILFHLAYIGQVFLRFDIVILPSQMRAVSLGLILILTFLQLPAKGTTSRRLPWYDVVLILMSIASTIYLLSLSQIVLHGRAYATNLDCLFAFFLFIPLVEAMRRTGSLVVLIIGVVFMLYAYFANYFPGFLWGPGWGIRRLVAFFYTSMDGFYGMAMGVFALILVPFLTFSAILSAAGIIDFFTEVSLALAGWTRGGPAKVAVVSSGLFGTISGSAVANVVVDGAVTIPMMMKVGFKPEVAAAIEAAASTGGQIMPPVMGAAAFLMAEFLGVSYWTVAKAAVLPAIFYYFFLYLSVDAEAQKNNLKGLPREQLPSFLRAMARGGHFLIPIIGLLVALSVFYWRVEMCALFAMGLSILVSFVKKETMLGPKRIIYALEDGAKNLISIGVLSGGLGMIIGICGLTGLGINLSGALIEISRGNLLILLVLTAVAAFILGMGMPTASVYLFCAITLGPALIKLGVDPMAAHMFIFYWGLVGLLTPPVALAAYAAAPIVGASPFLTGWQAVRISLPIYIVPFIFIYQGGLLLRGGFQDIIITNLITLIIMIAFVHGATGVNFFTNIGWRKRIIFLVSGLLLIIPNWKAVLIGLFLFTLTYLFGKPLPLLERFKWMRHLMGK
jgi:TRAP transporter 4TM/12TM fusion protein